MNKTLIALIAAAAFTGNARSEERSIAVDDSTKTRYGVVYSKQRKSKDQIDQATVFVGKTMLPLEERFVSVSTPWQIGDKDIVLVQLTTGATWCEALFALLILESDKVSHTDTFGNCSDLPRANIASGRLLIKFPRVSRERPASIIEYDGSAVYDGTKRMPLKVAAIR